MPLLKSERWSERSEKKKEKKKREKGKEQSARARARGSILKRVRGRQALGFNKEKKIREERKNQVGDIFISFRFRASRKTRSSAILIDYDISSRLRTAWNVVQEKSKYPTRDIIFIGRSSISGNESSSVAISSSITAIGDHRVGTFLQPIAAEARASRKLREAVSIGRKLFSDHRRGLRSTRRRLHGNPREMVSTRANPAGGIQQGDGALW